MTLTNQNCFKCFPLSILTIIFIIILLFLPYEIKTYGLKTNNKDTTAKKTFPFHKINYIPIKEEDDIDEDIRNFFDNVHHTEPTVTLTRNNIDDDENHAEEDKKRLSSGFFGWLFGKKKVDVISEESQAINEEVEDNIKQRAKDENKKKNHDLDKNLNIHRNGIINLLQSLTEVGQSNKSTKLNTENIFFDYFNRWPFNVIFPLGKHEKFLVPTKIFEKNWRPRELNSDNDFETLLESLPSFYINPDYVDDLYCKQQIKIWQIQLRRPKIWTLQMLDSSAKISSGLLRGNLNQFGDFDMCTNIRTLVKVTKQVTIRIKGKYCLAHIQLQPVNEDLKLAVHLLQSRGLWNSHLGDIFELNS